MIGRVVRSPRWWLAVQVGMLVAWLALAGKFLPDRVADTASYEQFPFGSWRAALDDPRTFGYPLFLRAAGLLARDHRAVPACHFLVHVAAVVVFWRGLRAVVGREGLSMLAASALLYSNVHLRYVATLTPDCLASSASILAVAGLLFVGAGRADKSHWVILTAAVAAAYHLRPVYVFMVPLIPLAGGFLRGVVGQPAATGRVSWRLVGGLLLATAVPLFAYSGLRWVVVGRAGLVSFGGNNFAGVMTVFLTPELEPRLPPAVRPLAAAVLEKRGRVAAENASFSPEPTLSYREIESRFDVLTWQVCVPAARSLYDDWPTVDARLWQLALGIVRARPDCYAIWLGKAFWRGVYLIVAEIVGNPVYLALLLLLLGVQFRRAWRTARAGESYRPADREAMLQFNALLFVAVAFAGLKLLCVMLTTPPLGRFTDAAGVLLPVVLAWVAATRLRFIS